MNVSELKTYFTSDFLEENRILTLPETAEQQLQDYLQNMAQRLIGDEWDFTASPIYFTVTDNPQPNTAFFANPRYEMKDGDFVKDNDGNKIELPTVPMIFMTKGLLEYVNNEDELAFILGHELGHFRQEMLRGDHKNTKIEEASSDYGALDMMARAGYSLYAARDIASRIFTDDKAGKELSAILARAFDSHPNNQSRMNFIDVSIIEKNKNLRKQNIDLRDVQASPLDAAVLETVRQNRHISFVEQYLLERNYAALNWEKRLNVLDDCIGDSEHWYKDKGAWSPQYHINGSRQKDILREFAGIISEMREQLPRRLMKKSDYELCTTEKRNLNDEQQKRRTELLNQLEYQDWSINQIKETLSKYPHKVVADEDFAQAEKENEALRRREVAELAAGVQPNQCLFERAYRNVSPFNGFTEHPDREGLYNKILYSALYNLETIPLNDNWPLASVICGYAENYLRDGDADSGYLLAQLRYLSFNNDSSLTERDKSLLELPNIGAENIHRNFHSVFSGLPLPELTGNAADINKKIPLSWRENTGNLEKILGISCDTEISDNEWVLSYYNPQHPEETTNKSYYIVNAEGVITAYYSSAQYEQLKADIRKKAEDDIYNRLVAKIRADKKMVEDFVAHPDISRVSFKDLERMKFLTSFYGKSFANLSGDNQARAAELETLYYSEEASYEKRKISEIYSNEFYGLRENSSFRFARNMSNDENKLRSYLSSEEVHWFDTYNHSVDMGVFKGYIAKLRDMAANQKNIPADEYPVQADFSFDSSFRFHDFSSLRYCSINGSYSLAQVNEIVGTVLDNFELNRDLEFVGCDDYWRRRMGLLDDYKLYYLEMHNLYKYIITRGGERNVDYHDFKPLFMNRLRPLMDIKPLDLRNPQEMREQIKISENFRRSSQQYKNREWLLRFETLQGILTADDTDYSLAAVAPLLENTAFVSAVAVKMEPVLLKAGNWPADLVAAAELAQKLHKQELMNDPAAVIETFITMFGRETDAKVLENALLALSPVLNSNRIPTERQNLLKDKLLNVCAPLWRQELGAALATFSALAKADVFAADMAVQNRLLESFVPRIEQVADADERSRHYMHFMLKANRIDDPEIRRRYQQLWVNSVFSALGSNYDDNSAEYRRRLTPYVEAIKNVTVEKPEWGEEKRREDVAMVDRIEILRLLADRLVSQQALSQYIKPEPSGIDAMEAGNLTEGHATGVAFELIKGYMDYNSKNPAEVINFLLSAGTRQDCEAFHQKLLAYAPSQRNMHEFFVEKVKKDANPQKLSMLYREFWSYPLEARAVLINELLHSQASRADGEKWQAIFNIVADRVFPNTESEMSRIGKEFLHSYIKSRSTEERTLYLAAMMVAANGNSSTADPEKSIARGIRLFLENSGPAAIKLGQAMASYPDVPKFIRDEMQELKSNAARPSRWEVYEWLDFYKKQNPEEKLEYGKDVWLGRILGSASYFVTLEKGRFAGDKIPAATDKVIKILRAGAELDSAGEFKVFENMLCDLGAKGVMPGGIDTFLRLVKQARDSVAVETNLDIGYRQLKTAQDVYPRAVEINGRRFNIHVADWTGRGQNWAELERAHGIDLDKIKDDSYRKDFSKAYFTVEMVNMLSGGRFDHDRHGKQLKIDTQTDTIGLFDTGAMAVVDPDPRDKALLGRILYQTANELLTAGDQASFAQVGEILSAKIEQAYHSGEAETSYLTEFQRGLLALNDFYKDFSAADYLECLNSALNNASVPPDTHIMNGFIKEGIGSIGLFAARQNLLSYEDKERVGRLLFNVYARSLAAKDGSIKEVIAAEIAEQEKAGASVPLFSVIKSALNDKHNSSGLGLSLPPQFIPSLSEIVSEQNVDVAILKGMMKEAVYALDIQQEKSAYSVDERRNFGRVLYHTFAGALEDKKQHRPLNLPESYRRAVNASPQPCAYAAKILAVLNVAESRGGLGEAKQDTTAVLKGILLSGHMDKEIAAGIAAELMAQNPDSTGRRFMAKGLKYFLTQDKAEPGLLKKAVVRLFVRRNQSPDLSAAVMPLAENNDLNRGFIEVLRDCVKTAGDKLSSGRTPPKINLVTSSNTGKIA